MRCSASADVADASPEDLFFLGLRQLQEEEFEKAAATFGAVEAALLSVGTEGHVSSDLIAGFVSAKIRRAAAMLGMLRWDEALAIFEELFAEVQARPGFVRDAAPDVVPSIYWGRAVCLKELGKLTEACAAVAPLIEAVGTGTTPTQRAYVAGAYLLQASAAEVGGRFGEALKAVEAAIAQCSGAKEPQLIATLHEAERRRQALTARDRSCGR